ncbi:MAG: histidinol-phosphate aminotransferase family protein, partial [Saccharolobus sp.]
FTIGYRSIELERLAVPWRLNSIVYYVISNLDPKKVRYFFMLSQNKIKEIYDKVKSITTSFKIYKTYAPYFLVKFKIPTKIINDELIKRGYYIRDCSNFLGLDETYGRIALREDVDNLIYTINEIVEEKTH